MSLPKTCVIDEIGPFWTDELLFTCVKSFQSACPAASLPRDVITGINPYLLEPSNLPEGIWYVVYLKDPKQAEVGLWKVKGDPCQIYSDSSITGWRTTLEFYEGRSPKGGSRTDWVMQEYSISYKGSSEVKGSRSLCRVFLSDRQGESKKPDQPQANEGVKGPLNKPLENKLYAEMERLQAMLPYQGDNLLHADYLSAGHYLELNDLPDDPQTSSSSSGNSSCVTPSSDVYFDSDALLQELRTNSSSYRFTISRPNDMVLTVSPEGSPVSGNSNTVEPVKVEASEAALAPESKQPEKNHIPEDTKTRPPPALHDAGASTSRQIPRASKGKKAYSGKTIKKFFCFIAF